MAGFTVAMVTPLTNETATTTSRSSLNARISSRGAPPMRNPTTTAGYRGRLGAIVANAIAPRMAPSANAVAM